MCVAALGAQITQVVTVQATTDGTTSATSTSTSTSLATSTPTSQSSASADSDSNAGTENSSEQSKNETENDDSANNSNNGGSSVTSEGTGEDSETSTDKVATPESTAVDDVTVKDTTADTDKVTAPVVVNNPNKNKTNQEAGYAADKNKVVVDGHIEVTNESGTADSKATNIFDNTAIIENNENNNISAVFTYTDDVPAADNSIQGSQWPTFYLPAYFADESKSAAVIVVDQGTSTNATDWQTTLLKNSGLPANSVVQYTTGTSTVNVPFQSLSTLGADFDVSKITGLQISYDGGSSDRSDTSHFMPANTTYTVTVPLKVLSNDLSSTNVSKIGVSDNGNYLNNNHDILTVNNLYNNNTNRTTSFRIANKLETTLGTVTETKSNNTYVETEANIQDLLPTVEKGDISYSNFPNVLTDATESDLYSGGYVYVNQQYLDKLAKSVNDQGYSLILNSDGSIGVNNYVYNYGIRNVAILPDYNGNSGTQSTSAFVYLTLRQLLNTKDSTMDVGSSWNAADNLATVTAVQDNATPATISDLTTAEDATNHVSTTISDPDGVLDKDGKAVKAGSFQVTYSMKDGNYTITKTATITVNPSDNSTTNNSGNTNSGGSTTGNNGGSETTTDDNNGSGTGNSEDTTTADPDIPVISPSEVPDPSEISDSNENIKNSTNIGNSADSVSSINNSVVKNTDTVQNNPVYTVGTMNSRGTSGILTDYTPSNATQQAATIAKFPQTGNVNENKLQIIGTMILTLTASVAGFVFGKKHHTRDI